MSHRTQMSCSDAVELQPWLLNGSLEAAEEEALREHLAGCEGCRTELGATAGAWGLLTQHIPSLALAEYALGVTVDGERRELYERHLARCPSCRQELEWVTADRVVDFETERSIREPATREPASPGRRWRKTGRAAVSRIAGDHRWAIAAGLAAILAIGGGVWTSLAPAVLESPGEIAAATDPQGPAAAPAAGDAPRAGVRQGVAAQALLRDGFESGRLAAWSTPESDEKPKQPSRRRI